LEKNLTYYLSSALWGALLPYLLLPIGLFLVGTFLSGSPPNITLGSSADIVLRLLSAPGNYFAPLAATWFGWRSQNRRVAVYSGLLFSLLTLNQTLL
jgi:hypothetical protein